MPDGRMAALRDSRREESPGSTEARCRVTPGGGDPRESATEKTPPSPPPAFAGRAARVKWCGKSAPRRRQRRRQGKPHREQDQVGAAGRAVQGRGCRARLRAAARVGCWRRPATDALEEWPSPPRCAIPGQSGTRQGGTEPGLQTVWRPPSDIRKKRTYSEHRGASLQSCCQSSKIICRNSTELTLGYDMVRPERNHPQTAKSLINVVFGLLTPWFPHDIP
jgi:hypothetical protein